MTARHGLFVAGVSGAGVTQPQDARLALAALLTGPGVVNNPITVTGSTSGPNMKYTVPAAAFATQRGTLATDGLYLWVNDAVLVVDSGSPAPSSGTRYDVIYALAKNANDGFGDASSDPVIGVVVGTASGSPSPPAAPAGALVLAQALVPTSAPNSSTATITQLAATATADQPDTGWLNLGSFVNGFAALSGHAPQARQIGNIVYLRGFLTNATVTGGYTTAAQLPAGIGMPNDTAAFACGSNAAVTRALQVTTAGALQAYSSGASSANFGLSGVSYPIN